MLCSHRVSTLRRGMGLAIHLNFALAATLAAPFGVNDAMAINVFLLSIAACGLITDVLSV